MEEDRSVLIKVIRHKLETTVDFWTAKTNIDVCAIKVLGFLTTGTGPILLYRYLKIEIVLKCFENCENDNTDFDYYLLSNVTK